MLEKRRLADELKTLKSLRHHINKELPWLGRSYPHLLARTNELREAGIGMTNTLNNKLSQC